MKLLITALFVLGSFSAAAMEVSVRCTPKAYACYNGPHGSVCEWSDVGNGVVTTVLLDQIVNRPEVHFGRFQNSIDGHLLTLDFTFDERKNRNPLRINAYLAAANVMAETSGTNNVEIALRNNTYGRGFTCNQVRVNN